MENNNNNKKSKKKEQTKEEYDLEKIIHINNLKNKVLKIIIKNLNPEK